MYMINLNYLSTLSYGDLKDVRRAVEEAQNQHCRIVGELLQKRNPLQGVLLEGDVEHFIYYYTGRYSASEIRWPGHRETFIAPASFWENPIDEDKVLRDMEGIWAECVTIELAAQKEEEGCRRKQWKRLNKEFGEGDA